MDPVLLQKQRLGVLAEQPQTGILGSVERDPNYEYGNILPFRKPVAGGPAQWGLGYSNALKSLYDAFTAPGRALQGEQMTPEDAMNFALASGVGGMALGGAPVGALGANVLSGRTWYKGMYPHDYTKEVWNGGNRLDLGPLIDPKDIRSPSGMFPPSPEMGEQVSGIRGFFSDSPDVASRFAQVHRGAVYPVNLEAGRVFKLDAKGKRAAELQFGDGGREFREAVKSGRYDAIEIKNTADEGDIAVLLEGGKVRSIFER